MHRRMKIKRIFNRIIGRDPDSLDSASTLQSDQESYGRTVQNFCLIWLDKTSGNANDMGCMNTIAELQHVVNELQTFTDIDKCVAFINDMADERIFMISSGVLGQTIVPIIHDKRQISAIYIFCGNKTVHEQWTQQWPKVKGVFTDISPICDSLKQAAEDCDQNSVSMSFAKTSDGTSNKNLNELDQSFMYTLILKEILLTIDFEQECFNDFLTYCRKHFANNNIELRHIDKIENEYQDHQPVWWYTYNCFLYSMLNRALRTMEIDLIIKLGFFIRDLHQHIAKLHSEQYSDHHQSKTFTVYRGQGLSQTDFDQLKKENGGLLSFHSFLSTSKDRDVSLGFARRSIETSHLIGILFVMKIDPSKSSTPFAKIHEDITAFRKEEEILFSMHAIFRIGSMKQIDKNNDRLWQVELTLTSDNDPQLCDLTEYIRKETFSGHKGWYRLGALLIKLDQYDKAEQLYNLLLTKVTKPGEEAHLNHMIGIIKSGQGQYEEAIHRYEKAIEVNRERTSPDSSALAASYNGLGSVYSSMNDYPKAHSYYEKALIINQKTLPSNHPDLATSYNNMGGVHESMEEYTKALSYYKKALEIYKETLPWNHPTLADCYNNIGSLYEHLGKYSKALSCHEKALYIRQRTLPSDHHDLACSIAQIGMVTFHTGNRSKAIEYCERALKILEQSLLSDHPDVELYKNNLEYVKNEPMAAL
ncbi:unnamed protein product [Adineta steineri]|uniref:ADP ribosyltransferase domain-containing protein n=1 Tax=Adineta steineri TaxID=433720 RepID=A0A819BDG2_9BILA|nr:unnamed protein product [Adineta steineri]